MKKALILIIPFLFSGCLYLNDRGLDNHYYNNCKESYDSMGNYHKDCDENLVEYKDVKSGAKKVLDTTQEVISDTKEFVTQ